MDSAGNLYGTTSDGGASNDGTVFELPKGSNTVETLVTFNGANGSSPRSGLTFDAAGNLFGTTNGVSDLRCFEQRDVKDLRNHRHGTHALFNYFYVQWIQRRHPLRRALTWRSQW